MDGARNQFLTGAGFAKDTKAGISNGDAIELRHYVLHGLASPDNFVFPETLAELKVFRFDALELQNVFNSEQQFVGRYWLLEKIQRSQLRCAHRHFDVRL